MDRTLSLCDFAEESPKADHFAGIILEMRNFRKSVPRTIHLSPAHDGTIPCRCCRYTPLAILQAIRAIGGDGIPFRDRRKVIEAWQRVSGATNGS